MCCRLLCAAWALSAAAGLYAQAPVPTNPSPAHSETNALSSARANSDATLSTNLILPGNGGSGRGQHLQKAPRSHDVDGNPSADSAETPWWNLGAYPYPLLPGSPEWDSASPDARVASTQIPSSWQSNATTWQLLLSAVRNPYFPTMMIDDGGDRTVAYNAAMKSPELAILGTLETKSDLGVNVLRFIQNLDIVTVTSVLCAQSRGAPCWLHYVRVCDMAGRDSALKTMDMPSIQRLFRLATWDGCYSVPHFPWIR